MRHGILAFKIERTEQRADHPRGEAHDIEYLQKIWKDEALQTEIELQMMPAGGDGRPADRVVSAGAQ